MDVQSNLEFLCRVCAANTKGKNSVAECVYILKTPGLRDKLDKFLYLKIFENDALPKVLCKSCFRQVEATASLSKIAKHTQQVFRDFLFSSLPKNTTTTINADTSNNPEYTSSDFLSRKETEKSQKSSEQTMAAGIAAASSISQMVSPPPPPPPTSAIQAMITAANTTPRKDDVIVNVSVSDPLTRENQQKVISHSQRRHSIMIEASSAAAFANLAQMQQKPTGSNNSGRKSSSPSRVMKSFCAIAPKPLAKQTTSQQPTQVTTFTSGGYVIGPVKPPTTSTTTTITSEPDVVIALDQELGNKTTSMPLAPGTAITVKDNTILQQKRKNLVKALNNIKANSSGQVSLLKNAQPKQQSLLITNQLPVPPANTTMLMMDQSKHVVTDELPDRIIIAAPKNKPSATAGNKLKKSDGDIMAPSTNPPVVIPAASLSKDTTPQTSSQAQPAKPSFPEDILLGRVIRDVDLLKLILKALKWPVNKQNMELQLQRLKNTRFTDIMSDPNLLQDTDLTQLLGPYLAPVLMAAQALQQQHNIAIGKKSQPTIANNTNAATLGGSTIPLAGSFTNTKTAIVIDPTTEEINKAIPYKLPPETSVQLVPALPEECPAKETIPLAASTSLKRSQSKESGNTSKTSSSSLLAKRSRKSNSQKHRDSIVISDEDEDETIAELSQKLASRSRKPVNNYEIDLSNPSFLAQLSLLNGASSELANEALMSLLQKQRVTMSRQQKPQKRRHNSLTATSNNANEFDALIDIDDDIVLMEPVTTTTTTANGTKPANSISSVVGANEMAKSQNITLPIDLNTFVMPSQLQNTPPVITRPIIKHRKTVIQSSRKEQASSDTSGKDLANCGKIDGLGGDKDLPTNAKNNANELLSGTSSTETSPSKQGSRKQLNKAALGQQLLEAIGLQKNPNSQDEIANSLSLHYVPTTSTTSATNSSNVVQSLAATAATSKQSVQQIRSALKRSLKQAQEKQEMRNKEISSSVSTTVIQDADSTTKPAIKEIVIEHRSNKMSTSNSSNIDIEEQIDKITLVKSQNTGSTTNLASGGTIQQALMPEKPEMKKEQQSAKKKTTTPARITERRCTLPSSVGRVRFSGITKDEKEKVVKESAETSVTSEKKQQQHQVSAKEKTKSEKLEEDAVNVSSSNITSTEGGNVKEEANTIPRRRGRKRATEVNDNIETAETGEKDKDKEKESPKQKDKEKDSKEKDSKEKDKENHKEKDKDNDKDSKTSTEKSKQFEKIKEESDETSSNSGRPTRQSKTQSKYYKGPEKAPTGSRRSLPARSTRNRNPSSNILEYYKRYINYLCIQSKVIKLIGRQ
ncbi:debra isoform X2 [Haematobia irritans]|uniref:debra isoform X2 n=1 Tax=Haematobia irritans TaxID=7368 RepID=UPI003F50642C